MKVVIVEDELRIREGLVKLLERSNLSIEIVAVSQDGISGLNAIEQVKPDLVITDIRMPGMDGLEMLSTLADRKISCKVIVLSAYSEFGYAQKAIKFGVVEYLIKPIVPEDLIAAIRNIEAQLLHERVQRAQNPQQFRSLFSVLYSLYLGSILIDDELRVFLRSAHNMDAGGQFGVLIVNMGTQYEADCQRLRNLVSSWLEGLPIRISAIELPQNKELVLVLDHPNARDISSAIERMLYQKVSIFTHKEGKTAAVFGWGLFVGLEKLRESVLALRKKMDWNLVQSNRGFIQLSESENKAFPLLPYPIELETKARSAICAYDFDRLREVLNGFIRYLQAQPYDPSQIKETVVRFVWAMISVIKEIDFAILANLKQQEMLERISTAVTWNEVENAMEMLLRVFLVEENVQTISLAVRRTKSMVYEYYNQGITLDEIANKLNITPEYLGLLFHREVGMTFSKYIKAFRIKKAKGMLIGTDMKLYEIASAVGYTDPKYFSQVFRELEGCLPADFRKLTK